MTRMVTRMVMTRMVTTRIPLLQQYIALLHDSDPAITAIALLQQ